MDKLIYLFATIGIVLLCLVLVFSLLAVVTTHEVETYSIGMVVSNMDYAATRSGDKYRMGVRSNDLYATLVIDEWEYGKYSEGDIVEVQVRIMEDIFGNQYNEFLLLGYSLEQFR